MLLLLLALLAPSKELLCQENECVQPLCSQLAVEVIRTGDVDPNCNGFANSCSDRFRQVTYKMYLQRKKTVSASDPLLPFDLKYEMLDVSVNLKDLQLPQFSFIDVAATQSCFQNGVGAKWDYNNGSSNKVVFEVTEKSATISFANQAAEGMPPLPECGTQLPNGTGNVITLTHMADPDPSVTCGGDGPPIMRCYFAELFTVVVNTYPG